MIYFKHTESKKISIYDVSVGFFEKKRVKKVHKTTSPQDNKCFVVFKSCYLVVFLFFPKFFASTKYQRTLPKHEDSK